MVLTVAMVKDEDSLAVWEANQSCLITFLFP